MLKIDPPPLLARHADAHGVDLHVLEYPAGTRSAADAAKAIGCAVAHIGKSLIFEDAETDDVILVICNGADRVASHVDGRRLKQANADTVRQATGYAIGGVPPFGHTTELITYIDPILLSFDHIWVAAGSPRSVMSLTPAQLIALTGGTVSDVID